MNWDWGTLYMSTLGSLLAVILGGICTGLWRWARNRKGAMFQGLGEGTFSFFDIILFSGAWLVFYSMKPVFDLYDSVIWYDITITFFQFVRIVLLLFLAMGFLAIATTRMEGEEWKSVITHVILIVVAIAFLTGIARYFERERDASSLPPPPPPAPAQPPSWPKLSPPVPPPIHPQS